MNHDERYTRDVALHSASYRGANKNFLCSLRRSWVSSSVGSGDNFIYLDGTTCSVDTTNAGHEA